MSLFFNAPLPFIAGGPAVSKVEATGGNNTYDYDGYRFHEFTGTGNLTVTSGGKIDVLLVGGGGGGGSKIGGGGGGGEVILAQSIEIDAVTFTATVGNGGTGTSSSAGSSGQSSSFSATGFTTIAAKGGSRGGGNGNAQSGFGNGGGEGYPLGNDARSLGSSTTISAGTHGSSSTYNIYSGGDGSLRNANINISGGGGGAGATGSGVNGQDGIQILNFDQYTYYYGGGGGGAAHSTSSAGSGGAGGGGGGGCESGTPGSGDTQGRNNASNGTANVSTNARHGGDAGVNTGGGGGGAGFETSTAGNGGSGIIIIRYAI